MFNFLFSEPADDRKKLAADTGEALLKLADKYPSLAIKMDGQSGTVSLNGSLGTPAEVSFSSLAQLPYILKAAAGMTPNSHRGLTSE